MNLLYEKGKKMNRNRPSTAFSVIGRDQRTQMIKWLNTPVNGKFSTLTLDQSKVASKKVLDRPLTELKLMKDTYSNKFNDDYVSTGKYYHQKDGFTPIQRKK
jgi:hypothetical protein